MKWLPVFCCLLWPLAACAGDPSQPDFKPLHPPPPNVEIINGKKFFSLSNARRFTGDTNSPRALSVLHHPRTEGTIASRHISPLPFSTRSTPTPLPQDSADKVLSIFAPDDKTGVNEQ